MADTGFNYSDFIGRNAIPYERRDNENFEYPIYNHYNLGGGALRSTVPDLAKFLIVHMNQGRYNNKQILVPQTVDLMQTADFSIVGSDLGNLYYTGQGLGWPIYLGDTIGYSGMLYGFLAQIAIKTVYNNKYGIIINVNRGITLFDDDFMLDTFFPSILDLLFEEADRLSSL